MSGALLEAQLLVWWRVGWSRERRVVWCAWYVLAVVAESSPVGRADALAENVSSVCRMQTFGHVNNSWFSKDRALLVFDPKKPSLLSVQILDRDCQNVDHLRKLYHTLIQSIRMINCEGKNVWQQQDKKWSTAALGMDHTGHILFIHVRSPFSTHDLIDNLLKLPIRLKRAMYVEGGSEAQMYIHSGNHELEYVGSYSTGATETDANTLGWPIPNVVGITRLPPSKQ